MPATMRQLAIRDASSTEQFTPTMHALLIALVVLGFVAAGLCLSLYVVRTVRKRRARQKVMSDLPMYERGHTRSSGSGSAPWPSAARASHALG